MSTVLPPPTRPPANAPTQELSLDDLNDNFWAIVQDELESNSASLSEACEQLLRTYVSKGAMRFLQAPSEEQNLNLARQNLRSLLRRMVQTAAARGQMAASAGGTQATVMLDEDVFYDTLNKAKQVGWRFWPFS
jgi:DNA-binding transcriptional regulator YbjK